MAGGHADDLATAILLATTAPVLVAPAMNPKMWSHPATRRNVETLRRDGIRFVGPNAGEMAEAGEAGVGRMAEPPKFSPRPSASSRRCRNCSRAVTSSSPPAPPTSRSTRCAISPTVPPAARATPSPKPPPRPAPASPSSRAQCRSPTRRPSRRPRRDRAPDAGRGRGGPARRRRRHGRGRRRLARRTPPDTKIKKEKGSARPRCADRKPRHPRHRRPPPPLRPPWSSVSPPRPPTFSPTPRPS